MTHSLNSLSALDANSHLHPYSNLQDVRSEGPLVFVSGQGIRVQDENGKSYIDSLAGLWCATLGFSEDRLADAANRQLRRLPFYHGFFNRVSDVTAKLAVKLVEVTPETIGKVFLANSGSEANDTALKLAWYYNNALGRPEKKKIIAREKGYHGVTIASGSMTQLPINHGSFDLPLGPILKTTCPHHYKFAHPGESEDAFSTRLAEELEQLILAENPETIAAFIAEPAMGAGGAVPPPQGYFDKIQPILRQYDILLIADEVITAFGRTGNMFGCDTYGIRPDMMTLAKGLSAGYQPISALGLSNEIHDAIVEESGRHGVFGHGFTYGGHPVPAAVALEAIRIYESDDIVGHVRRVGPVFQKTLRALQDHPLVGEARGVGLMGGLDLMADAASRTPFDPALRVGQMVHDHSRDMGLLLRYAGDTLLFGPPLIITEDEIAEFGDILLRALDKTHSAIEAQRTAASEDAASS
ncbi:MAG: aminotransferase [Pseudomonadota bacterium]